MKRYGLQEPDGTRRRVRPRVARPADGVAHAGLPARPQCRLYDSRCNGEALNGSKLGESWKYWLGHYRFNAHIEDNALRVLVIRIGNGREEYRNLQHGRSRRGSHRPVPEERNSC